MSRLKSSFVAIVLGSSLIVPQTTLGPAFAAESSSDETASNKAVDLSGLVVPVELDGKLVNYLFVSIKVVISSKYNQWDVREQAHVYRDKILRVMHKDTVGVEGRPMELDEEKFRRLIKEVFDETLGVESVDKIEIVAVDSQKIFVDG